MITSSLVKSFLGALNLEKKFTDIQQNKDKVWLEAEDHTFEAQLSPLGNSTVKLSINKGGKQVSVYTSLDKVRFPSTTVYTYRKLLKKAEEIPPNVKSQLLEGI